MNQMKKNAVYEYVVVGAGLTGLAIARALSKEGAEVLLVDSQDVPGGHRHPISTAIGPTQNGLTFVPATPKAQECMQFLSALIDEPITFSSAEREPLTYESGGLKSFLGFGESSPEFYDEFSYFLHPSELLLSSSPTDWIRLLSEKYAGDWSLRSYVTKFHHADGKIHSMTLNGQKTVNALNFIYAGPLKSLKLLLPETAWSVRAKQKFSKAQYWTSVGIDFVHNKKISEIENIHVLNGTTQDEVGPCVGRFLPAVQTEQGLHQVSQWMTFVDDEEAEDTEKIGIALKKIKRQLKRAYPEALDHLKSERILAIPSSAGGLPIQTTGHQNLPQANNLWIASSGQNPFKNIVGSLSQAQLITSALGMNPLGTELDADLVPIEASAEENVDA